MLGFAMRASLASVHPTVQLAEQIRLEQSGQMKTRTDATEAFRATGEPVESLYERADQVQADLRPGAGRSSAAGWGWSSPSNWCSFPFAAAAPITNPTAAPVCPADVASGIAPRSTRGRSSSKSRGTSRNRSSNHARSASEPPKSLPYRIAVRTATVAAVFSLVVAALMLYDFFHRSMKDPSQNYAR